MTLPRIAVHRRIWLPGKCHFNLRLRSLENELILLGKMHENGRVKHIELSRIFLSIGAVSERLNKCIALNATVDLSNYGSRDAISEPF